MRAHLLTPAGNPVPAAIVPDPTNPTTGQRFVIDGHPYTVTIMINRQSGIRAARITPPGPIRHIWVPVAILPLCAGKDLWMRRILVKCATCRKPVEAGTLEGELCPACFEKAAEENEAADGK